MEEIMKQYSGAFLVGLAGAMLFVILFVAWPQPDGTRGSVLTYMGDTVEESLDVRKEVHRNAPDSAKFDEYANIPRPTAKTKVHAVEQTPILLSDLFLIKDGADQLWDSTTKGFGGKPGVVDVLAIKSSGGQELVEATDNAVWNRGTQILCFPKPDSYLVTLRIKDTNNVDATYTIPVAVDMLYPE